MSETRELLGAIGLCARAGKLVYGIPMICEALKQGGRGAPILVLEAGDTSENSHKRIGDRCRYYNTKLIRLPVSGGELGACVGKTTSLGAVAVTDAGLAAMVENKCNK